MNTIKQQAVFRARDESPQEANQIEQQRYANGTKYIAFWRQHILVSSNNIIEPAVVDVANSGFIGHHLAPVYLGQLNQKALFAIDLFDDFEPHPIEPFIFVDMTSLNITKNTALFFAAQQGLATCAWVKNNQYCNLCGSINILHDHNLSRQCVNPECRDMKTASNKHVDIAIY